MNEDRYLELRCRQCGHRETMTPVEMLEHLRSLGMFKRQQHPDESLLRELFSQQISLLRCAACGEVGYGEATTSEADDEQWGAARTCQACRRPIAEQRLEVFPDAQFCTACQSSAETGQDQGDPEYCPRCGAIMQLRQRGGAGLTAYVMHCPDCGYR